MDLVILLAWAAWVSFWLWSAQTVPRNAAREKIKDRQVHVLLLTTGILCLIAAGLKIPGFGSFSCACENCHLIGTILIFIGHFLSIWARVHLGKYWSAEIGNKHEHAIVETGPYRIIRHPIYTGILFSFLGTSIALGRLGGWVGFAILFFAYIRKTLLEERYLRQKLPQAYMEYCNRVKYALFPLVY